MPANTSTTATTPARRRVNACVECHHKKIRCDLDPSAYRSCSNCASLDISCRRRQRKPYTSRRDTPAASRKASPAANRSAATDNSNSSIANQHNDNSQGSSLRDHASVTTASDDPAAAASTDAGTVSSAAHVMPTPADWEPSLSAVTAPSAGVLTTSSSLSRGSVAATEPFFSGDPHGYGYVLNICNAGIEPSTQHHFIPSTATFTLDKADLAYAEAKGCFAVLTPAVREDFIYAYFHYVHPMLPIIDIRDFHDRYWGNSGEPLSMLLLWSMFSVSAGFVPEQTVKALECEDRHELKKMMYNRAKCLFMLDYEQDSLVAIQSCLLIGYWYSNLRDRTQSWYWTGIAISTAQTIGLHRNPDAKRRNPQLSPVNRRLWRNVWWCCVLRDRWLAFGSGRPLRIKSNDHDIPFPDDECMLLPQDPSLYSHSSLIPSELSHLSFLFLGLLRLAIVLGDIMESIYQSQKPPSERNTAVASLAQRLGSCFPDAAPHAAAVTTLTEFFTMYAQIHVEAATIALYRPFTTELSRPPKQGDLAFGSIASASVRKAASRTNALLDRMISADTLVFAGPTMVSLLISAMTIHLHEVRSSDQFTKAWSSNRLDFCLLVLKHLERNYPAATLIHKVFVHARDKNCLPFGISESQHTSLSVDGDTDADFGNGGGGSGVGNDHGGGYFFPSSDSLFMPDFTFPPSSSQHFCSLNDLDDEAMAPCPLGVGSSSIFPMDMDSFMNIN